LVVNLEKAINSYQIFQLTPMRCFFLFSASTPYLKLAGSAAAADTCPSNDTTFPGQQWVNYEGTSYIFTRQQFHTTCVDGDNQAYEYGALTGYYTTGEPCASACVEGKSYV
jgi:hypothetical protein